MKPLRVASEHVTPAELAERSRQARRREIEASIRSRGRGRPDTIADLAERIERIEIHLGIRIEP